MTDRSMVGNKSNEKGWVACKTSCIENKNQLHYYCQQTYQNKLLHEANFSQHLSPIVQIIWVSFSDISMIVIVLFAGLLFPTSIFYITNIIVLVADVCIPDILVPALLWFLRNGNDRPDDTHAVQSAVHLSPSHGHRYSTSFTKHLNYILSKVMIRHRIEVAYPRPIE